MSSARKIARRRAGQVREARAAALAAQAALDRRERQDQNMRIVRATGPDADVREITTRCTPRPLDLALIRQTQRKDHLQHMHEAQARELGLALLRAGLITVTTGSGMDGPWMHYAVRVVAPPAMPEYATVKMVHP